MWLVNKDQNNFWVSRLEHTFPSACWGISTLTTPVFVKLINCIWYSVWVSGHYSLTSLTKPVCQGFYYDSEGLHWICARDHDDRLVELNVTQSYAFNRASRVCLGEGGMGTGQICGGKFRKQKEANIRNTVPIILSITPQ